jgi:2-polyprenyl-3-methyl-5-hydroxy-6-metoxy-1,4-benzoquinol methylase
MERENSLNTHPGGRLDWDPITHYKDVAVAERYDRERFSSLSGRVFNALERRLIRRAFRDAPAGATVLDLPCGTGRFAEVLLQEGFRVVGIDISPAMLAVARRKAAPFGARFEARVADVRELAGREAKRYDVALCARVLMHFPLEEQIRFLRGVATLTRGKVVFSQSYDSAYQRLRRGIKRLLGNQPPANYPIGESQLQRLLAGAGLREVRRLRLLAAISEAVYIVAEPV